MKREAGVSLFSLFITVFVASIYLGYIAIAEASQQQFG
jgi:hypothetical protein